MDEYYGDDGIVWEHCECDPCYTSSDCSLECNAHGACVTNENGTLTCDCEDTEAGNSYTGEYCQTETCPHTDNGTFQNTYTCTLNETTYVHGFAGICNGAVRGTCVDVECFCSPGWSGANCSAPACVNGTNGEMCSGTLLL